MSTRPDDEIPSRITRRTALLAAGAAGLIASHQAAAADIAKGDPRRGSAKRYDMKKSINLWAFPLS